MKEYVLKIVKLMVFAFAVVGAATPSLIGGYNPKSPEKLKNFKL